MRRRTLLAGSAAATLGVLLPRPVFAALDVGGPGAFPVRASHVDHDAPLAQGIVDADGALVSAVIAAGQLFERAGASVRLTPEGAEVERGGASYEERISLELRASPDGLEWTDWIALPSDPHLFDGDTNTRYMPPQVVPAASRFAQYRLRVASGRVELADKIALTLLDVTGLNAGPLARIAREITLALAGDRGLALAAPTGAPKILTRADWGADESLMKWTPNYVPWQKAVVHHTVTSDGGSDVAAEIRAIYYFHAVTRGWGDIGYTHIADKYGNIWICRQGGDNVVAGHAYGWNDGTLGIAALGDYSYNPPTSALQSAIENIISLRFRMLGVAPYGSGAFTHHETASDGSVIDVTTTVANVLGHRDLTYQVGKPGGQTACPGDPIYGMLDGLRKGAQTAWQNGYTTLVSIDPQLQTAGLAGAVLQVPVVVTNAGTVAVPAGTLVNYRVLQAGRVVATGAGAALASPIAPGARGTAAVPFLVPAKGSYVVRWDLQTGSAWWNAVYNTPFRDQWFRSADWSASWIRDDITKSWIAGEVRIVTVTVQNDGGRTWNATGTDPVQLGYWWTSASGQRTQGSAMLPLPQDVGPGATVTLRLPVVAPQYPASGYTLTVDLYKTNEFWFKDKGVTPDDTPITTGVDFKAQYTLGSQIPSSLQSGQALAIPVTVANVGRGIFPAGGAFPVDLGYHWFDAFGKTVVWDGARTALPADLAPGASVTLNAKVTAPTAGGSYTLKLDLVQEGVGWFSSQGVDGPSLTAAVAAPVVAVYGATYLPDLSALALQGGITQVPITVKNTSNFTWLSSGPNPVDLGYHWTDASGKVVVWEGLRTTLPADVAPGASVTLQAQIAFPSVQGTYTLRWDLVREGVTWFSGKGVPTFDQSVVIGPRVYGGSIDVSAVPATFAAGATVTVPLRVQNLSNFDWDGFVDLSYHWIDQFGKVVVWEGARTTLSGIRVNEVRAVNATVVAPASAGAYRLRFDIVQEGVAWFSGQGMQTPEVAVQVTRASYGAEYSTVPSVTAAPNATITVPVAIRNTGSADWQPGVVNASYHLIAPSGNTYVWDGKRTAFSAPVTVGQTVVVNVAVLAPDHAGTWTIRLDLVQEGVAWFSALGVSPAEVAFTVQ